MSQAFATADHRGRILLLMVAMMVVALVAGAGIRTMANAQEGTSQVTIVKVGLLGEDTATFSHNFHGEVDTFELSATENAQVFSNLAAGTYSVTELPLEGYVLMGAGCSLDDAPSLQATPMAVGNTVGITVSEGQHITCTFVNGATQVIQHTVTVVKHVDGELATEGAFEFTATWTAPNLNGGAETSADFTLDQGNSYTATTSPMDAGSAYSVVENGIDATCDEGDQYRLLGYSIGESLEAAVVAEPVPTAVFADLQSSHYVVVQNETCEPAPAGTSSITIVKEGLTEGVEAVFVHDVPGDSDTFTLTADNNSFTVENLAAGTYRFTELPIDGWRLVGAGCAFRGLSPDTEGDTLTVVLGEDEHQVCTFVNEMEPRSVTIAKYVDGAPAVEGSFDFTQTVGDASDTLTLDADAGFIRTTENIAGGSTYSLVEDGIDSVCDDGDAYRLAGYSMGATLEDALDATPVSEVNIESLTSDLYVVVWNQDCDNLGTITIVKDFQPDSEAQVSFIAEGLGVQNFTIGEGAGMTFEDLGVGNYTFTEEFLAGWRIQSIFCSGQQSPSNILINLGAASLTVTLTAGDSITCTFTNVEDASSVPGNITIVKSWGEDEGVETSFVTSENLGIEGNRFTLIDSEGEDRMAFESLAPATYTFTEVDLEGWTLTGINCTGMNSPESIDIDLTGQSLGVNLAPGETVVCTFSNRMDNGETPVETGSITITKVANPDLAAMFSFTTTGEGLGAFDLVTGDPLNPATITFGGLEAGSYTVTEAELEGWTLTDIVCEGFGAGAANGDINTGTVTINLVAGAEVECTYTNTLDELIALLGFVPFINPGMETPVGETPDSSVPTNPVTNIQDSANAGQQPPTGDTGQAPSMSNPNPGIGGSTDPFINPGQQLPGQPETQDPASVLADQAPQPPSAGNAFGTGSNGASTFGLGLMVALLMAGSIGLARAVSRR